MYYTGIGSRKTPNEILELMEEIGKKLGVLNYILRSGAAGGADSAFEKGCDFVYGYKEIFLPWPYFNGHSSSLCYPSPESYEYVKKYHPYYKRISKGAWKLHARNAHQVLGRDLNTPSRIVICFSSTNKSGTNQAIRIANAYGIPVYNLALNQDNKEIIERLSI